MKFSALKYLLVYTLPLGVYLSFHREGWQTFLPLVYGFGIIPLIELFIKSDPSNLSRAEEELVKSDRVYDWLVWLIVPVQVGFLIWYFFNIQTVPAFGLSWWGRTLSMGMMCGVLGINVAHELGHRVSKAEQVLAKVLLMTSLYPHFFIEHNYGHHKHVATAEDPASARLNESLYRFWLRSIVGCYFSAWQIERRRLERKKLLETVNYIEHYGLSRQKVSTYRYENTTPVHSWNSNHIIGRMFLFELSRHSDHHAFPHKKYPLLQSYEKSPQMPTGYPGMMLLSTLPPLWFSVMNARIKNFTENPVFQVK